MRFLSLLLLGLSAVTLFSVVNARSAGAAPNTDDPLAAMATRSEEEVQQLSTAATEQYRLAAGAITSIVTKMKAGEGKKVSPKEFATAYVAMRRMERLGKQLEQWGETAGIDFQTRASGVATDWDIAKREFIKQPEISSKLPLAYKSFRAEAKKREKNLNAVGLLYKQQKYLEAETAILKDIEALDAMSCLLDDTQMESFAPFMNALGKVMAELNKIRVQAGKERLLALIEAEQPGFEALLAQMKQATTDLKAGQKPKFDDVEMTGPEFVAAAGEAWRKSQLAALHGEAFYYSMDIRKGAKDAEPLSKLAAEQENFSAEFLTELGAVLAADAARTTAADAEAVYLAYLPQLALLATLAKPGIVEKACAPHLESLVACSAELQANVAAYQAATDDLLRWKRLVADEQQRLAAADFPTIPALLSPVLQIPKGESVGLLHQQAQSTDKLALLSPLPLSIERMKTQVLGKNVLLNRCVGVSPAKKLVASHYADRHYATFTLPAGFDVEQQALRADLLVSTDSAPLTLAAAMAVTAADRGDLQAAGASFTRIHVEPLATRMATFPAAASGIFPLGPLPREAMDEPPLYQILLRSEVQPQWVRNEYFFLSAQQ